MSILIPAIFGYYATTKTPFNHKPTPKVDLVKRIRTTK